MGCISEILKEIRIIIGNNIRKIKHTRRENYYEEGEKKSEKKESTHSDKTFPRAAGRRPLNKEKRQMFWFVYTGRGYHET